MSVYELARLPRITAGVGARERIAALAGAGGVALLVADPGLISTGLVDETTAGLRKGGFAVSVFTAFQSDPTIAQADAAAAQARDANASVVVGLGGGSALDLAKAVAAIAPVARFGRALSARRASVAGRGRCEKSACRRPRAPVRRRRARRS